MPPRGRGPEWAAARVLEALRIVCPDVTEATLERVVREVCLVEYRRGVRYGMLEAARRVTCARERFAIRQIARGRDPDDPTRAGPPPSPW